MDPTNFQGQDPTSTPPGSGKNILVVILILAGIVCLWISLVQHYQTTELNNQPEIAEPEFGPTAWTSEDEPSGSDKQFLDSLVWHEIPAKDYTFRVGIIQGQYMAAFQLVHDGHLELTEYTPPSEYISFVDPDTGWFSTSVVKTKDINNDGVDEIIFLNRKLDHIDYQLYTIYSLGPVKPKLIWSGPKLDDSPFNVGMR